MRWVSVTIPVTLEAALKDPIRRLAAYLVFEGILTEKAIENIHAEADTEMAEAAKVSEQKPPPPIDSLFDDVYAVVPPPIARQRESLRAEGGSHSQDADAAFPL